MKIISYQNKAVLVLTNTEVAENIGFVFCGKTLEMFSFAD